MADPAPIELKSSDEIRDDICRTYRAGLINLGVESPNVTPGSDIYVLAQAIGDELEVAMANVQVMADRQMPDTATGEDLDRLVANMPMDPRKVAQGASGFVTYSTSSATVIAAGEELTGGNGFRYAVKTTGSYANGDSIEVVGVDTGSESNLGEGETLRWVTIPPFAAATVVVETGGLDGGSDAEGDEELRARLLAVYRNPPRSGNTGDVIRLAEESSPTVQKAFAYPAPQGPGTFAIAVVAAPTSTSKARDIATATVTGTIKPYLDGNVPEHAYSIVNTVANVYTDVAIGIGIPDAKTASPSGPGGGWIDGTPWPTYSDALCRVVSVTTPGLLFEVECNAAPVAGVTHIAWMSPLTWTLHRAKVTTVHTFTGATAHISIDTPFPGIAVDHAISPDAENIQAYFDAILSGFAKLGPGELSSTTSILAIAYRRPRVGVEWKSALGTHVLRELEEAGNEVDSAEFIYREHTAPAVPSAVTDPPKILVPNNIGLYPVQTS